MKNNNNWRLVFRDKEVWEDTWIEELLSALSFQRTEHIKFRTPTIFVARNDGLSENETKKLARALTLNKWLCSDLVLFHLSDEYYKTPWQRLYQPFKRIVRVGHAARHFPKKVLSVPIGLSNEFMSWLHHWTVENHSPIPATERKYDWTFVGQVEGKPTRAAMLNAMHNFSRSFEFTTAAGWKDPNRMKKEKYAALLAESIFAPCPRGWSEEGHQSVDGFRTWEATTVGAIPIVDDNYYKEFFGAPFPLVSPDWHEAPDLVRRYLNDPSALRALQDKILGWWQSLRGRLPLEIKAHIEGDPLQD